MRTIKRNIVTAIITSSDDQILLGKMRSGGVYPDCWHSPGGGTEPGETLEDALRREMLEETGIDLTLTNATVILLDNTGTDQAQKTDRQTGDPFIADMRFHAYQVAISQPASDIILSPNDDITQLQWFKISKLSEIKLTPPGAELFKNIGWI